MDRSTPTHAAGGTRIRSGGTRILGLVLVVLILLAVGCAGRETKRGWSADRMGSIGAKINRAPDQYEKILEKNNITPEEFDRAIQQIASDPELAEQYSRAFMAELRR